MLTCESNYLDCEFSLPGIVVLPNTCIRVTEKHIWLTEDNKQ